MDREFLWREAYADGVPRHVDYDRTTLPDALKRTAGEFPDKEALIFIDSRIKFKELNDMVNKVAAFFTDSGIKQGDMVAMLLPNIPQIVIATFAAWRLGAVVVMNNPLYSDREIEHQLNDSGSTVLVTLDLLAPRMIALQSRTKVQKIVVAHIRDHLGFPKKQLLPIVAKDKHRDIPPTKNVVEWMDILKKYPATDPGISVNFDSLACLQYTGGTTGVSKGVMLTHSNLACNVQQIIAWFPTFNRGELVGLGVLPFFHIFGMTAVMNYCIWQGFTNVLIPKPEPHTILEAVKKHNVGFFPAVPTMYVGVLNYPKLHKYNLSSIKGCFSGAAPLPLEVIREFEEKAGAEICEAYGLSETSPAATINPYGGVRKSGSIGVPVPDTDMMVVDLDEGTKEMPVGEPGELIIRGPQVTSGYYNMPDETAIAIRDGWLYTGDIAQLDEDGYIYIVDRKKDMIIAGGYNIYPRDIDEVLFEHPKVLEACAIGIPDEYRGETVKVFVVLKAGETMTQEEVIEYSKTKLAKYKVPQYVEFIGDLPKSGVGKILRKELRQMELSKMEAQKKEAGRA